MKLLLHMQLGPKLMLICSRMNSHLLCAVYLLTSGRKYTKLNADVDEALFCNTQVSSCL